MKVFNIIFNIVFNKMITLSLISNNSISRMIKVGLIEEMQPSASLFSLEKSCKWTMHSTAGGRALEQLTSQAFSIDNHSREPGPAKCCSGSLRDPQCNYQSRELDMH